ncbi:hypothetical protein LCGC14_0539740 [marine sediment metagenome]|uniref:Uncharacterized protein n=1 Tax=marine sediment metagenome TaxID=412755 RepID=A0A0F9SBI6_9ZZZZ
MAGIKKWTEVPAKHREVLEWWLRAYRWFNRRHPSGSRKITVYTNPKRSGLKWGGLDLYWASGMSRYGIWSIGGAYTQHYIDYYILKNAPIKDPPLTRPRKPAGYDDWLARLR